MDKDQCQQCSCPDRRGFLKRLACHVLGAITVLVPAAAGLAVWLDPVRRKTATGGQLVRVASLTALPDDGVPRKFAVLASRVDAWNKSPETAIGAVYLRREKGGQARAFNVVCPHAGCFVNYQPDQKQYLCPCHNSSFALDGAIKDRSSPSPRPLDTMEVKVSDDGGVWVKFENYRAGIHEKVVAS